MNTLARNSSHEFRNLRTLASNFCIKNSKRNGYHIFPSERVIASLFFFPQSVLGLEPSSLYEAITRKYLNDWELMP